MYESLYGAQKEPPWEWVDGDPVRSSQFTFLLGILLGITLTLFSVYLLANLGWGVPSAWGSAAATGYSPPILWLVLMASVLVQISLTYTLPRRIPVIGRLGISPTGLRIRAGPFAIEGVKVAWWAVRKIGPDWVEVAPFGFGSQRYKLTQHQAQRLRWFLTPH